ncbi:hypothetical protein M0R45_015633 [Rubus argutus]|uniref:Uncharacterized protein n=1 Tax=Rubus argutus TaxID=59490 RepID=A0AAW1XQ66_RUBAR
MSRRAVNPTPNRRLQQARPSSIDAANLAATPRPNPPATHRSQTGFLDAIESILLLRRTSSASPTSENPLRAASAEPSFFLCRCTHCFQSRPSLCLRR